MLGVLRECKVVQIAMQVVLNNAMYEVNELHSGQAHLRITCLPGSHQRPSDLGNALGLWGSITISRVWAEVSYLTATCTCMCSSWVVGCVMGCW